jgi:hypothetical protein
MKRVMLPVQFVPENSNIEYVSMSTSCITVRATSNNRINLSNDFNAYACGHSNYQLKLTMI